MVVSAALRTKAQANNPLENNVKKLMRAISETRSGRILNYIQPFLKSREVVVAEPELFANMPVRRRDGGSV